MFLIQPYTEVSYQADTEDPYQYYWVGFNGLDCHDLLTRCGFSNTELVIHRDEMQKIIEHMDSIANIRSDSFSNHFYLLGHLYQLFGDMIQNQEKADSHSRKYYDDAIAFIRQNACLPEMTTKDVAAHIGIERSHLYRIFKDNDQVSIKEVIMATRMEKAKLFLANTDQSIDYITTCAGFKNESHFCKRFKQIEGITPLQYRQKEKAKIL